MGAISWRGVTTKRLYRFMTATIPASLINAYGQPVGMGTYNGETLIETNTDGSVRLPVATGPPVGASVVPLPYGANDDDIYSAFVQQSFWTEQ